MFYSDYIRNFANELTTMDKEEVMERIFKHSKAMHSDWCNDNRDWVRRSQEIALRMLNSMDEQNLTQRALAERMGCTQQYISKVLKGQENLSLETLVKIEDALGIELLVRTRKPIEYNVEVTEPMMAAEDIASYGTRGTKKE